MNITMVDFDDSYIPYAAELMMKQQKDALGFLGGKVLLTHDQCCQIIKNEWKKNIAAAIVLLDRGKLIGYAIAIIENDSIWGKRGWVNMGGWAISRDYSCQISLIYQFIAEQWIKHKVYKHYFLVYSANKEQLEILYELGFAKEQAHGIFDFSSHNMFKEEEKGFLVREAEKGDQSQISKLSRVIAEHQVMSPCFAWAPESYLKALDKGFSELTDDDEALIYVIEKDRAIIGLNIFHKEEQVHPLIPDNSAELAVCAVEDEYRGQGAGYQLTAYAFNQQKNQNLDYLVTDWRCANLQSSKFWQKIGFLPVAYRLFRPILGYS